MQQAEHLQEGVYDSGSEYEEYIEEEDYVEDDGEEHDGEIVDGGWACSGFGPWGVRGVLGSCC